MNLDISSEFLKQIREYNEKFKPKILFGLPMYGGKCFSGFFKSFINLTILFAKLDIRFDVNLIDNESLIQRARNNIVNNFLTCGDFTHLMFLDCDLTFPPERIIDLLINDLPIAGCLYPKKGLNLEKVKKTLNGMELTKAYLENNRLGNLEYCSDFVVNYEGNISIFKDKFINVRHIGTGFMLIKKQVFLDLIEKYPEKNYTNELKYKHLYNFFDCMVDPISNTYLSEDYYFCDLAKTVGHKCWVLLDCDIVHTGSYNYSGNFLHYFKDHVSDNKYFDPK